MSARTMSFLTVLLIASSVHGAVQKILWGESSKLLPEYKNLSVFISPKFPVSFSNTQNKFEKLKLKRASKEHARYQQTWMGVPIWGHELIFHKHPQKGSTVTGTYIYQIESDIGNVQSILSKETIDKTILSKFSGVIKFKSTEKVIYIDKNDKAHLAWHLSFYTAGDRKKRLTAPNYLIDDQTGNVLKRWDALPYEKIGQGLGGNAFNLPYRPGGFQHGDALPGLPSLGKFDVKINAGLCQVENDSVRIMNLFNAVLGYESFPISVADENNYGLEVFSYACDIESFYLNYTDSQTGPVNYSFSPVNDTMYFAGQTLEMYQNIYGVSEPLGSDVPLRAYTHLGGMDNAFAIPSIVRDGVIMAHQQIVIGNGDRYLTAPAQSVIAHELSHNLTGLNSGLFYEGQSGGINESFSDMSAIALQDYLRRDFPWYWDGMDWALGREAVIGGQPLRFMDEPTKDGMSIAHASDYTDDLDVHFSSGVFNRAFYLLSTTPGWSVQLAFQVMVDANRYYWSPIAYYDFAACGVIQAAVDKQLDSTAVVNAFSAVGVHCPVAPIYI